MENPNNIPGRPDNTDNILNMFYPESGMILAIYDTQNYRVYGRGPNNTRKDLGLIARESIVNHPNTKSWYAHKVEENKRAKKI